MAKGDTMDSDQITSDGAGAAPAPPARSKRLIIIAAAAGLLLAVGGGVVYMTGMASSLFGGGAHAAPVVEVGAIDLPDIVANLNAGRNHTSFVKLKVRLELAKKTDENAVKLAQGRMLDLFQTYLRDMHPDELRGAMGTYRLREELLARANIALAPARVTEILFLEMLIQ